MEVIENVAESVDGGDSGIVCDKPLPQVIIYTSSLSFIIAFMTIVIKHPFALAKF